VRFIEFFIPEEISYPLIKNYYRDARIKINTIICFKRYLKRVAKDIPAKKIKHTSYHVP